MDGDRFVAWLALFVVVAISFMLIITLARADTCTTICTRNSDSVVCTTQCDP